MADKKIRLSDLPLAKSTDGLITLGVSRENESVKIPFGDLLKQYNNAITEARDALNKANEAKELSATANETSQGANKIAQNASSIATQSGSSRFEYMVQDAVLTLQSYIGTDGSVCYISSKKVFAYRVGSSMTDLKFYANWNGAEAYMNSMRNAILKDKLYLYDDKVWIWSDTEDDLIGLNEDALQAMQEQINKITSTRHESVVLSETEYEALESKKDNVLYLVYEEE